MSGDPAALARLAERAAARAAAFLRRTAPPDPSTWQAKAPSDFVTEIDRTAERMITETLCRAVPGSRVLGEEGTPRLDDLAGLVWVVDPLDGTTNFLHGYPVWAVSIGAAIDGELVAGCVFDAPAMRRVTAWTGGGTWCNGRRVRVSSIADPGRALLATGFPFKYPDQLPDFLVQLGQVLPRTSGVRRGGAAAVDLLDVALGHIDAFWEMRLAPWDTAAGIVLVREAGGVVTRLDGAPLGVEHAAVVAGNPAMHDWLLKTMDDRR